MQENSSTIDRKSAPDNSVVTFFVQNRAKFLNFVRSSVREPDSVEEILQRASLKIISHAAGLRNPGLVEAWIYRILRNEITDHFRRTAIGSRRTVELSQELPAPETTTIVDRPRLCPCAIEELGNLRPSYAEALRAVEMDGGGIAAYAATNRISANGATVRVHRARKALRARLLARCGSCAGDGCFACGCGSTRAPSLKDPVPLV
jgi:DNA-directed RNA polymerase specialized sigma24 family protein